MAPFGYESEMRTGNSATKIKYQLENQKTQYPSDEFPAILNWGSDK